MGSELADANKRQRRVTRSRLAKPLLTSMGTITMLGAGCFVLLAVASTGSARPWDWTRTDPAAAVGRYRVCGSQGLGAIGCMLSAGFRPASAAPATAGDRRSLQPLLSVATVQDQPPAGTPATVAPRPTAGRSGAAAANATAPPHAVAPPRTPSPQPTGPTPGPSPSGSPGGGGDD